MPVLKHPCKVCKKSCKSNQNSLCCDLCDIWIHLKCTELSVSQFNTFVNSTLPYFCNCCIAECLPINYVDIKDPYCLTEDLEYLSVDNINKHFEKSEYTIEDLTVLHVNTRSLTKNINRLEEVICLMMYQPDLIAITETKLNKNSNINLVQLPGYHFFHINSLTQAGGVALYIKCSINFNVRKDLIFHDKEYESIWIELVHTNNKLSNSIFGVMYRHPKYNISEFTDSLSDFLQKTSSENKNIFITGDINIDLLKIDSNHNIQNYSDMLSTHSCANAIELPTRITDTSETLIDHFYCNNPVKKVISSVILSDISDHLPILVTIKNSKTITGKKIIYARKYNKINNDALIADASIVLDTLKQVILNKQQQLNTNDKFELFTLKLKQLLDKHAPLEKLSRKETKLKTKPWITSGILKSIQTRNRFYKELCKCKFRDQQLHNHYKKFRNKLTRIKEKSKQNYYSEQLQNSKGDSRKTWNVINNVLRKNKKSSNIPSKLEINDKVLSTPHLILNGLNDHFASIGKKNHTGKVNKEKISETITVQPNSIFLHDTTEHEVSAIISKLNSKKAPGADDLSVVLLKKLKNLISPILSILINESFKKGIYPNCLKIAKVIPIYKGGTKSCPGNYRPISLLSIVNKIVEKIIYVRLISFFDKHSIIKQNQFGFREGYSTTLAITEFYEDVLKSYDESKVTCAVLLDLSKAFDSVNHDILLYKLSKYGIRGNAWCLLHSYLSSRQQYVTGNNISSKQVKVDVGVPQGSVLGPLLFLIHINDLVNSTNLQVLNFADDTLLYYKFDNPAIIETFLNNELEKIKQWLNTNHLTINTSKTKYLIFSPNSTKFQNLNSLKILIGKNSEIQRVSQYKYLGLIIDDKLTWKPHILYLKSKLSKALGLLFKARWYLNKHSLLLLLHSLFITHLEYGILCWGRCGKPAMDPLIILMNKAIRCINFCHFRESNVARLFNKDKILQVKDMFELEIAKFMFKYVNQLLPINFERYFISLDSCHNHDTRASANNYFKPRKNNNKGLNTLSFIGPTYWFKIPDTIKNSSSLYLFTSKLKSFTLQQYL